MQLASIVAIYFLFFFLSLFVVLPFGVRTADEAGIERVPGQAESAPAHFSVWRAALKTGLVALVLTALFHQNYVHGWITRDTFTSLYQKLGAPPL